MPKRKRSKRFEEDLDRLLHKVRKLKRRIRDSDSVSSQSSSIRIDDTVPVGTRDSVNPALEAEDWIPEDPDPEIVLTSEEPRGPSNDDSAGLSAAVTVPHEGPSTSKMDGQDESNSVIELDTEVLQILGEDPTATVTYGPEIRKELACRLQHVATEGLSKETRKELLTKYAIPANCLHIDAPKINAEIKGAIPENFAKRDKGIEVKQKQMASAIACLGEVITMHLNSKENNNEILQKLMDAERILCDIQHGDSVTRRNFILFSLKKELKEHLVNTKIDSFLFSENLTETLKSAKAVNRSSVELKADIKNTSRKQKPSTSKPLNRKAPAQARRQPGPQQQRSREPAAPPATAPPPPPARSYRASSHQQPPAQRRRQ